MPVSPQATPHCQSHHPRARPKRPQCQTKWVFSALPCSTALMTVPVLGTLSHRVSFAGDTRASLSPPGAGVPQRHPRAQPRTLSSPHAPSHSQAPRNVLPCPSSSADGFSPVPSVSNPTLPSLWHLAAAIQSVLFCHNNWETSYFVEPAEVERSDLATSDSLMSIRPLLGLHSKLLKSNKGRGNTGK